MDTARSYGVPAPGNRLFVKYDLDVAVLGCYLNLANPNEETMKKTYNRYFANIRFAKLTSRMEFTTFYFFL